MKFKLYTLTLLTAGLLMGCGGDEVKTKTDNKAPIKVSLSSPSEANSPFVTASGKIEAVNNASLSTRMMGFINKIHVNIGDKVKKGQLLVSINNSDLQAQIAQVNAKITEASAAYNSAEKDYERFKALFEENSASQKELDDITANYEMAKARLEAARQMKNETESQFAYVNIRAPFSGVITNKFVEEGTMANPGMPLLALEAPGAFEVRTTVPESEISSIQLGTPVKVLVKSIDKTIDGKVSEVGISAKNTGGQYPVKISLLETNADILSGMYVSVQFPIEKTETSQAVLVPESAIITRGDLKGIYTVSNQNTAMLRWIRTGRSYGDKIEVLSGLKAEEHYITDAEGKLYNGAEITVE
ncbi:efflux RND transporter periplasmic adaptor subunit [Gramella sp. AN32]|uniref:Efflux RND transporter periplasmic adaptor subunit n=1 Tax=Christiangramia antarctica TaxID=2058158 RepID=A0ABW5X4L0_9FLAO|nr:efflux RND transporter periplasmic adaptor subunit [Gramella sp. AN32]MCM4158135.1 efflux RND transporter periplasmic adaptor subunit [Gramella sp. AN32]